MSARSETYELLHTLSNAGMDSLTFEDANTLRRAQITLHRWAELECGDGDDYKSWAIERDEATGKPFMAIYPHDGKSHRYPIADREAGALKRVADICKRYGMYFYHQTDPRGCALYVSASPIPENDYNRAAVACVV